MSRRPDTFDALADPTRRGILELLRDGGERPAGDIAAAFPRISRPAVSKHLRVLRDASVVTARRDGREWIYSVRPDALRAMYHDWLRTFEPLWDAALAQLKQRAEEEEEAGP